MYDITELNQKLLPELKEIAKKLNIKRAESLRKQDLVYRILDQQAIVFSGKKKLNSVIRNREKRYIREIFRTYNNILIKNFDIIIGYKTKYNYSSFIQRKQDLLKLISKVNKL